jgi:transcriptional regulator with XRE-family HTH domain
VIEGMGDKIRELREQKQMSKELLAGIAGISVSTIEQLERGYPKKGMRVDTLLSIARALEVAPGVLLEDASAA